ncbi:hypothetical protein I4F81_012469 [Pyropia yezoensis]|uniref:Uncharacterized protein n=1 Tax=Pyropia yezoensis TaxID=2788 RepID=A0ACC3CJ71_PYRYE|nr:hypothetical protein I4F81_012469 [Neopyropia yezoensis]
MVEGGYHLNNVAISLVGGSSLRVTMDRCGGLSMGGHFGISGPSRGQRAVGAAFMLTPSHPYGWNNQTGRASLCGTRSAGVFALARRPALRRRARDPPRPDWRRAAPGSPTTVPSPFMSMEGVGGTGLELPAMYAEQPDEPALTDFWTQTVKVMDRIDESAQVLKEEIEAGGCSSASRSQDELNSLDAYNTMAIDDVYAETAVLLNQCSSLLSLPLPAMNLVLLWRRTLLQKRRGLERHALSARSRVAPGKCSLEMRQRLAPTFAFVEAFCKHLQVYYASLDAVAAQLQELFAASYPVAAMLRKQDALLSAGRQRSASSVLATFPVREEDLAIPRDVELVQTCAHLSRLARLKGTRAAWYLVSSPGMVHKLLTVNSSLVDTIIAEAMLALCEKPTIVAIEELNKVTPFQVPSIETSPAELECGLTSTDPTTSPVSPPATADATPTASLMSVYRHEMCTWTRLESVTVLLTAPFPGLVLAEVRKLMSKNQSAALDTEVAELLRAAPANMEMQSLMLTSLSSRRKGSPYFLLPAAKIGFLDVDEIADVYFLPIFRDAVVIRTSHAWRSSFQQPSNLSARAFARLSCGHPRSAALLLLNLRGVFTSCSVWSSVVKPAGVLLSQNLSLSKLLSDLLVVPAVLLAALHNCTLDSEQPLVLGINVPGLTFKSWDDVVSYNVLVGAVQATDGRFENPCMPPLFLVALMAQWKSAPSIEADATATEFLRLKGVFDALSEMLDAADKGGAASRVWELVSLYADVALTRLRAAAPAWTTSSPGVSLPHDYRSITLMQLYPGSTAIYSAGERPLLDKVLLDAVPHAVMVNDSESTNTVLAILERDAVELASTVFKCAPEHAGFDSIKFLRRSGSAGKVRKEDLVAVCKSAKVTGNARSYLNLNGHVRKSLQLMEKVFGKWWDQWKGRVVLVVESNHKIAGKPTRRLTKEEGNMVIVIGVNEHQAVYGRTLSGLMGDGPSLYDAKVLPRRRASVAPREVRRR